MKKLKALISILAISLGIGASSLYAAASVITVPVVHEAWTFIGVPGFQSYGASSGGTGTTGYSTSPSGSTATIVDGVGTSFQVAGLEVPTWDGNVTTPRTASTGTNESDGLTPRPASASELGSDIYATAAVMVLGQVTTGAHSSTTDHAGAYIAGISYTAMAQDHESPVRSMYIRSANAASPDVKVLYQARYEGVTFYIKVSTSATASALASTDTVYIGTFDKDYTYDNAAVLGTDFAAEVLSTSGSTGGSDVSGIITSFDMDFTDLNTTTAQKNDLTPSTTSGSLRDTLDGNLTVITWNSTTQNWEQFRASGDGSSVTETTANDFTTFTQGQGYWVKLDRDGGASYTTPSGFVLGYDSAADINHSTFVADGWNMLSFGDEYLSYSVTGMTIATGTQDLNITDTYGAVTLQGITLAGANAQGDCTQINMAIDGNNTLNYTNMNIRCIANAGTGIVLLSTRRFTVQSNTAPTSLDGSGALTAESNGSAANFYRSQYGLHALIVEPNLFFDNVTGVDGNMSVEFPVSTDSAAYAAIDDIAGSDQNITIAMDSASSSLTGEQNDVLPLDMDYDGTNDALLLASNFRFFIKDATLVRTFNYDSSLADTTRNNTGGTDNENADNNVTIRIIGASLTGAGTSGDITLWDDNLSGTALNIEAVAGGAVGSRTEVNATKLEADEDNTTIMIFYTGMLATDATRIAKIDIQEWGNTWDLLTETDASSETNTSAKGAIAKVWQIPNILFTKDMNTSYQFDGNYSFTTYALTTDLKNNAVYTDDFPTDGPLMDMVTDYGVQPELIITGQTAATNAAALGSYISWKQIDVSKDPDEWYDNDDQFELFWTEKEKGYWVYIDGSSVNDLSFETPTLSGTPYSHFNNVFSGTAVESTTRNHLNHTLTTTVNNLTTVGTANANTDAFEVYATIGGSDTSFQRVSATNGFSIPISSHETNGMSFDAGTVAVTITAAHGSGKKVTTSYSLDYAKPDITSITLASSTATVAITNGTAAASTIQVYNGDINDSNYGSSTSTNWAGSATVSGDTTDVNLGAMSALSFPTSFEYNSTAYVAPASWYASLDYQIREGLVRDVRFTAVDSSTLYSDMYRVYYVPIYNYSGILSSSSSTTWDATPAVFGSDGDDNTTAWQAAQDADSQPYDDGVQLKTAVNGTAISCAYAHQDSIQLDETTAVVKTIDSPSGTALGIIAYNPAYEGRPFYCEVSSVMYIGAFIPETQDGDITMQALSTSVTASITKP